MSIMNMPGFTAENSIYITVSHFQSEVARSFGSGKNDNQVYMQKPNSENTPGGKCYGRISGTVISGTYDSMGRCCTAPSPNNFPVCIDCDYPNKCYDRAVKSRIDTVGNFQNGFFSLV
ncbi:hypothetical protein W01_22640 [Candidatus Nitrotoga sp. AM1P]|nr:hypothetical protein W01_22640 [Candidatus Nitrotoga sp. AM1P]